MNTEVVALTGDSILARNGEIVIRQSKAEIVALDPSRGLFFSMNETANFILSKLDGYATLEKIAELLTEEFDVDATMANEAALWVCTRFVEQNFAHVITSS